MAPEVPQPHRRVRHGGGRRTGSTGLQSRLSGAVAMWRTWTDSDGSPETPRGQVLPPENLLCVHGSSTPGWEQHSTAFHCAVYSNSFLREFSPAEGVAEHWRRRWPQDMDLDPPAQVPEDPSNLWLSSPHRPIRISNALKAESYFIKMRPQT